MVGKSLKSIFAKVSHNRVFMVSAGFLLIIALLSVFAPLLSSYDYHTQDLDSTFLPPFTGGHVFGTDELGRDLFVRVWEGGKVSLMVGICAVLLQASIGVFYGGLAGMAGGIVDEGLMRFADMVYSVPYLIIVMLLTMAFGSSEYTLILALAAADWTGMARLVRSESLRIKEMEYVQAARLMGAGNGYILRKHILPNCMGRVVTYMMFSVPAAIFAEGFLSFVGLGIKLPRASWGSLASDGYRYMTSYPWLALIPVVFIGLTMLAFNIAGDALEGQKSTQKY